MADKIVPGLHYSNDLPDIMFFFWFLQSAFLYVGITRARKYLTLSMARARVRMGKAEPTNPSRFLFEIPKGLIRVTNHKSHG